MKLKDKLVLFSLSLLPVTAVYGNIRFQSSNYQPAFEVLPGISAYGSHAFSEIKFSASASSDNSISRIIELPESIQLSALYFGDKLASVQNQPVNSDSVQIVFSPSGGFLIKGEHGSFDFFGEMIKSYLGVREIFEAAKPLQFDSGHNPENPGICKLLRAYPKIRSHDDLRSLQKSTCSLISDIDMLHVANPAHKFMLINMQSRLTDDIKLSEHAKSEIITPILMEDTASARILIQDAKANDSIKPAQPDFWKCFDWIFGTSMLVYAGLIFMLKPLGGYLLKRRDEKMKKEDKEFKKDVELYESKLEEIRDKYDNAKTEEEVLDIIKEYAKLLKDINSRYRNLKLHDALKPEIRTTSTHRNLALTRVTGDSTWAAERY